MTEKDWKTEMTSKLQRSWTDWYHLVSGVTLSGSTFIGWLTSWVWHWFLPLLARLFSSHDFLFLYHWSDVVFIVHCLLILVFCFSLSSTRLQDNGVASSSSVDSLSCLQSGFKSRQNNRCRSSETSGSTTFKKQFDKVKSQSKLVNSSKIYCVDSQVQKMW